MHSSIQSFVLMGIDDGPCEVEVDIEEVGLPKITVVGLPDAAVKESVERVRSAISNTGYRFPEERVLINLAPADIRKEGPMYDLAIAVGVLLANGTIFPPHRDALFDYRDFLIAGEVALDGRLRPIRGAISMAIHAKKRGMRGIILPKENAREAAARVDARRVLVVTDAYHVFRAERVFARFFDKVDGVGSVGPTPARIRGSLREVAALAGYAALGRLSR